MSKYIQNIVAKVKHLKAFTLAEVLITLSIIGVIASMTIPSLVQDVQDAQLKTAWKKSYSDINQIMTRVYLDNAHKLSNVDTATSSQYSNFIKYASYTKAYGTGACPVLSQVLYDIKYLNNTSLSSCLLDDGIIILNNGNVVMFNNTPATLIWVDINGSKSPNRVGKDIFGIRVYKDRIKPLGSQGDGYENTCSKTSTGEGCSAAYLYQ